MYLLTSIRNGGGGRGGGGVRQKFLKVQEISRLFKELNRIYITKTRDLKEETRSSSEQWRKVPVWQFLESTSILTEVRGLKFSRSFKVKSFNI